MKAETNRQLTIDSRQSFLLLIVICLLSIALIGCHGDYAPKPKAYPRVAFPERQYEMYDPQDCPFRFEKPVYATVTRDSTYFGQSLKNDQCWLNVSFPSLNGVINLTYKTISDTTSLQRL